MIGASLAGILASSFRQPVWALTVQTTDVNQTWTVDINAGTSPEITIDWGDGSLNEYTTTGLKTHTYAAAGTYVAKLRGLFASGGIIRFGSDAGNRQRLKSTSAVPYIPGLFSFNSTFRDCTGLTGAIPADLFRYNTQVYDNGFEDTFYGCTGLTGAIPDDLFRYNTLVSTAGFCDTFYGCAGLTGAIPADLFRYNTLVSEYGFVYTFYGCTGLTGAIPADLFRYNTQVSTDGFYATFYGCAGLTGAIPADLFRYNTQVSTNGFSYTFFGCNGLTGAIPADLFRYNTQVSDNGFEYTFYGCNGLTGAIPDDLFRYNTQVSTNGFYATFYGCSNLTSAPDLLFAYCPLCTSFSFALQSCNKLQLPANLFSSAGDRGTRFLNQSVDFTSAMGIGTFTGTQGTAPDLWNYDFGTGTPTKTNCFMGHSSGSVSNFADIPAEWK